MKIASMPIRLCVAASVAVAVCLALFAVRGSATQKAVQIKPVLATAPVTDDPDDPAIWVNTSDPGRSLIFGTNKVKAPKGALVAYGLDGTIRQVFAGLDREGRAAVALRAGHFARQGRAGRDDHHGHDPAEGPEGLTRDA